MHILENRTTLSLFVIVVIQLRVISGPTVLANCLPRKNGRVPLSDLPTTTISKLSAHYFLRMQRQAGRLWIPLSFLQSLLELNPILWFTKRTRKYASSYKQHLFHAIQFFLS